MQKRKEDIILRAINFDPFGDLDGDGVPNILDCQPKNPLKDGFFRDLGGAIKTEIKGEVGEAKERIVEGIAGEERREERKVLREAEHEEAKEMVQERGKEKAQRKFTKHRIGEGFGEAVENLEEKVDRFSMKAGKHGKGMLGSIQHEKIDIPKTVKQRKSVKTPLLTPLKVSIPKKPIPSPKSLKPFIVPLTIEKHKRTMKIR